MSGFKSFYGFSDEVFAFKGVTEFVTQCMLQTVSDGKAENYKATHNFFVLEEGRSNRLLQTNKLVVLKFI